MTKKCIAMATLACFILLTFSCATTGRFVPPEEVQAEPQTWIEKVVTTDGDLIEFAGYVVERVVNQLDGSSSKRFSGDGALIVEGSVVGVLEDGTRVAIPLEDISMVFVQKEDRIKGLLYGCGIGSAVLLGATVLFLALKESCPFVYSFDGEHYVFDGEPYGGSICPALQRTDWCRLDHLAPVDGEYRLLLTNEVDETQYTDEMILVVVDHPAGVGVFPDACGVLHTVSAQDCVLSATDEHGSDLTAWFGENDDVYWSSDLRIADPADVACLVDTLYLTFPGSDDHREAALLVNGCSTVWASQMLRVVSELWGREAGAWHASLEPFAARAALDQWQRRECVYKLQVNVMTSEGWQRRAEIFGGGPFVSEDRAVPLDLEGVSGDSIRIMLTPPIGFWKLNWFAMGYTDSQDTVSVTELQAVSAVAHDGADICQELLAEDGLYYVSPEPGQMAELVFAAPPEDPELERTIFAQVSGYYDMHLDPDADPRPLEAARIFAQPHYIVRLAIDEYHAWRSRALASLSVPESEEHQ